MNALTLVFVASLVFALAYRYYGLFIAQKVLGLDPSRPTPAVTMDDGHDYHATNKYVLFGHHFAAIAAAGPLIGPCARRSVRLSAGSVVDHHRSRGRRRSARHGCAVRFRKAQGTKSVRQSPPRKLDRGRVWWLLSPYFSFLF